MNKDVEFIKRSALWAAYGDALGFITELADERLLKWRTGKDFINVTMPWRRRIGGKFGVIIDLPAGVYSDDTQLRLATSRAIRGDGKFDVEAFAKIELPVWLSYALGAGSGTKAASSSLSKKDISWVNNFFELKNSSYIRSGGNGAAMRIQPHVWASPDRSNINTFLPDVIRNSICTHGHARGILGAVFHACCVAYALEQKTAPVPSDWKHFVRQFQYACDFINSDNELRIFWLPTWENINGEKLESAFQKVTEESLNNIELAEKLTNEPPNKHYEWFVETCGGKSQEKGSGIKTAIFAAFLAWKFKDDPEKAMTVSANFLGSDTDTIATMAGAILGSFSKNEPLGEIQDKGYIIKEALRLSLISNGTQSESFDYPDILKWNSGTAQGDFVGIVNGQLAISGFGYVKPIGNIYLQKGKNSAAWQWLQLSFGQRILAKRNASTYEIPSTNLPLQIEPDDISRELAQVSLFENLNQKVSKKENSYATLTIDDATRLIINSGFDHQIIGKMLLEFSKRKDGIECAIAISSIIAKAFKARIEKEKK